MSAVTIIIGLLSINIIGFGSILVKDADKKLATDPSSAVITYLIGIIVNFFDTLGIGSFALATAMLKSFKQIDERILPGTLNVAMAIPVIVEAIIFIKAVKVDMVTLVTLILASVVGSYLGASVMSKLSKKYVKMIMGVALLFIAFTVFACVMGWISNLGTGSANGLTGMKLVIGAVIFFIFGSLSSAGVGLYAPAMATVYMLGLNPLVAFPIMMGACAFLMPVGAIKFIKESAYAPKVSLMIALGGVVGVIFATNVIKSLPLDILRWLVIVVVIVTGAIMLYEGVQLKEKE